MATNLSQTNWLMFSTAQVPIAWVTRGLICRRFGKGIHPRKPNWSHRMYLLLTPPLIAHNNEPAVTVMLTVVLPLVLRDRDAFSAGSNVLWSSGLVIQNVGSSNADVTVQFYDENGNGAGSANRTGLPAGISWVLYPLPVSGGFRGSALVTATEPVLVTVNQAYNGDYSQDYLMSYVGLPR